MARMQWNNFKKQYPNTGEYRCVVTSRLTKPGSVHLDKKGKILPTPYGLLREWLAKNLNGHWAARQETKKGKTLVILLIADPADVSKLSHFGKLQKPTPQQRAQRQFPFGYRDSLYGNVAKSLGYDI
ncbi:hypothetical protein [Parasphingorhabdus sp.]|uniref:hypothetical protein n=1 Tax=Parasphingorhabdus sp. TaxID=2709688 RepID=UPI003D278FC0